MGRTGLLGLAVLCAACFNPGGGGEGGASSGGGDESSSAAVPTATSASSTTTATATTTAASTSTTDERPTTGCASDCPTTDATGDDTTNPPGDTSTGGLPDAFVAETPVMVSLASALVAGPFDDDPRSDLFVASLSGSATLIHGGTLSSAEYGLNKPSAALVAINFATVDPDADDDLVLASYGFDLTSYEVENGTPTFAHQVATPCDQPLLALGNVVGDPIPDVVLGCPLDVNVYIFQGSFDGDFAAPVMFVGGAEPTGLAVANVVGSTRADLLISTGSGGELLVYRNTDVDMNPFLLDPMSGAMLSQPGGIAVATPDGAEFSDFLVLLPPTGCAYFTGSQDSVPPPLQFACGQSLRVGGLADLDGDTGLDVVTASQGNGGGTLVVWLKAGDTFTSAATLQIGDDPQALAFADLVGDERVDIAVVTQDAVEVLRSEL